MDCVWSAPTDRSFPIGFPFPWLQWHRGGFLSEDMRATTDTRSGKARTESVVRVTLHDGTRIQLTAGEIAYVEPIARGALIHLDSGESVKVVQDVRTVELRVDVALATKAVRQESLPDDGNPIPRNADQANSPLSAKPSSLNYRARRFLRVHVSVPALVIARGLRNDSE